MKTTSIVILGIVLAVLAIAAVVAVMVCRMKKNQIQPACGPEELPQKEDRAQAIQTDPAVVAGIEKYASHFMGLYSGIDYAVCKQKDTAPDAYLEWWVRMDGLQEDEVFCKAFAENFPREGAGLEHMQQLMACIEAAGILRDGKGFVLADEKTKDAYQYLGDGELLPGTRYLVLKPCWRLGSRVVEQGMLDTGEA